MKNLTTRAREGEVRRDCKALPGLVRALLLGLFVFRSLSLAPAQEEALDWDFDTLFDEPEEAPPAPPEGGTAGEAPAEDSGGLLAGLLRRSGFSLDLSYSANGGFSPGWSEAPWFAAGHKTEYSHVFGANLNSYLGLDLRISEVFRAQSSLTFSIPGASVGLSTLFFDYNFLDRVYFRVGKFGQNWGISPNFPAANLLSRVPQGNSGGDPYIFKADIPIGIGGLQFLALTRPGFMRGSALGFSEIGYGGKYNLAFTWADIDAGLFYHQDMPLRGSASVKTTVRDTELYFEAMGAIQHGTWDGFSFSANLGFAQSFLKDLFSVNGEIFWNGEDNAYYFKPKTELEEGQASPFIPGLNIAWNLVYRPGWIWNLRFAMAGRWALDTNTAYLLPGLSFSPLSHITVSLGFPVALGGREGRYYSKSHASATGLPYTSNADKDGRPFGIALLVNLSGSYKRSFF